jgi:hypothetical protein
MPGLRNKRDEVQCRHSTGHVEHYLLHARLPLTLEVFYLQLIVAVLNIYGLQVFYLQLIVAVFNIYGLQVFYIQLIVDVLNIYGLQVFLFTTYFRCIEYIWFAGFFIYNLF